MDFGMPALIELPAPEDCAGLCRELGLQFIELNMNLPQYQTDRVDAAELRDLRERYGVYYTLHLDENLNPCDFNHRVAEAYTRTAEEAIRLAKTLEIPVLNMHLSRGVYFTMPEKKIFLFDVCKDQYLSSIRAFRDRCEAEIGPAGLKICVESPVFGLTFDIGHNHSIGGRDEAVILRRRDRLCHFHFHDAVGKKNHLPLGTGEIDVEKYLALAKNSGGRIVLETKTAAGLKESVRQMRITIPAKR